MRDKYVGEWQHDKRHGQGTMSYSNGGRYEGQWQFDAWHGQGTLWFEDFCLEAEWVNGAVQDPVRLSFANGDCYRGSLGPEAIIGLYKYADGTHKDVHTKGASITSGQYMLDVSHLTNEAGFFDSMRLIYVTMRLLRAIEQADSGSVARILHVSAQSVANLETVWSQSWPQSMKAINKHDQRAWLLHRAKLQLIYDLLCHKEQACDLHAAATKPIPSDKNSLGFMGVAKIAKHGAKPFYTQVRFNKEKMKVGEMVAVAEEAASTYAVWHYESRRLKIHETLNLELMPLIRVADDGNEPLGRDCCWPVQEEFPVQQYLEFLERDGDVQLPERNVKSRHMDLSFPSDDYLAYMDRQRADAWPDQLVIKRHGRTKKRWVDTYTKIGLKKNQKHKSAGVQYKCPCGGSIVFDIRKDAINPEYRAMKRREHDMTKKHIAFESVARGKAFLSA